MTGFELLKLCARFDFGEPKVVAKAALVALATFYNEERGGCWPSQKELLAFASCDRKALFRAIAWLEEREVIFVDRFKGKGNFYRFNEQLLLEGSYQKNTSPFLVTSAQKVTSPQKDTSPQKGTTPVPNKGLDQSPKGDTTSPQKGTQINKKKIIKEKEKINDRYADDEPDFDTPLKKQIERVQSNNVDLNDDSCILNANQIVSLVRKLKLDLKPGEAINDVASKKVLTTAIVKEAVRITNQMNKGTGYLVGVLQNAVKEPHKYDGSRNGKSFHAHDISNVDYNKGLTDNGDGTFYF